MDWSAIFAGIATVVAIAGLVYSVRQHRENIRREFLLWAVQQIQSPEQREARGLIGKLDRPENSHQKQELIDGIAKGKEEVLYGEEYHKIRMVFALFSHIGYFWSRLGYAELEDAKALFPQAVLIWDIGQPYINAIRGRPNQSDSFRNFEKLVKKLNSTSR